MSGTKITAEMLQYVQRLVGSFGINVETTTSNSTSSNSSSSNGTTLSQETLSKRAQAAAQDPAFQRLKNQFASDFDFKYICYYCIIIPIMYMYIHFPASSPGPKKLPVLINKLKRWIKILELKTKSLQK